MRLNQMRRKVHLRFRSTNHLVFISQSNKKQSFTNTFILRPNIRIIARRGKYGGKSPATILISAPLRRST